MRQGAAHAACGRARAVRARAPPCALPPFTVTAPCLQAPRRPRVSCWVGQGEGDAHRLVLWRVRCVRLRLWRVEWARAVRAVLCMRRGACSGEQGGACVVLVLVLCVQFSVCGVCVRGGAQWARGAWRRSVQLFFFSPAFGGTCRRPLGCSASLLPSALDKGSHGGEFYWNSSSEERGDWRSPLTVRPCPYVQVHEYPDP
jgi:hypothetical protein